MKIIKQGKPVNELKNVRFRCLECGCIFLAEPKEYKMVSVSAKCKCPNCKNLCSRYIGKRGISDV